MLSRLVSSRARVCVCVLTPLPPPILGPVALYINTLSRHIVSIRPEACQDEVVTAPEVRRAWTERPLPTRLTHAPPCPFFTRAPRSFSPAPLRPYRLAPSPSPRSVSPAPLRLPRLAPSLRRLRSTRPTDCKR